MSRFVPVDLSGKGTAITRPRWAAISIATASKRPASSGNQSCGAFSKRKSIFAFVILDAWRLAAIAVKAPFVARAATGYVFITQEPLIKRAFAARGIPPRRHLRTQVTDITGKRAESQSFLVLRWMQSRHVSSLGYRERCCRRQPVFLGEAGVGTSVKHSLLCTHRCSRNHLFHTTLCSYLAGARRCSPQSAH